MRKLVRFFTKIPVLEIADSAVPRIRELLETNSKSYLKIGIRKRGCNGKTYTMNYANEKDIGKFDEIVEQDGVIVIIESIALLSIIGTKMNYTCNTIRSEFIFENPNAKITCGCGESFMT